MPYIEREHELWAIWANHDCVEWKVKLTLIMQAETSDSVIAVSGLEDGEKVPCQRVVTKLGRALDYCTISIGPKQDNFALLFKNGFQPIWYEEEWTYTGRINYLRYFWPW